MRWGPRTSRRTSTFDGLRSLWATCGAATKGGVLATEAAETTGKGGVLATKAVEIQGQCLSHEGSENIRHRQCLTRWLCKCAKPESSCENGTHLSARSRWSRMKEVAPHCSARPQGKAGFPVRKTVPFFSETVPFLAALQATVAVVGSCTCRDSARWSCSSSRVWSSSRALQPTTMQPNDRSKRVAGRHA